MKGSYKGCGKDFLMELRDILNTVAERLPDQLDALLTYAGALIPADIDVLSVLKLIGVLAVVSISLGILGRFAFGKESNLNRSVCAAIGILFLYVLTVVIYTFKPWNLEMFLSPLPFVTFRENYMILLPFQGSSFPVLCDRILSMVILAFLVNLLDVIIPRGETIPGWYVLRLLSVAVCFILHFVLNWAISKYIPNVLTTYAPMILLGVLVAMLLVSLANVLLGALLIAVNPIIGAIYAFFFSNKVGQQLSKAVLTTILLCGVFGLLEYFGYSVILISFSALPAYLPLVVALLLLWFLVGHAL